MSFAPKHARRIAAALAALCIGGGALAVPGAAAWRNVYTAGGEVRPAAPVAGDFVAAGGRILLEQPVGGDAALAAGTVDVRAPVAEDLRAAGGSIGVGSRIGGDLVAAGADIAVRPGAIVGGMTDLSAASIAVEGRLDGALRARAQTIRIDGEVRGPVELAAQQVELGPRAVLRGPLTYASPNVLRRADGAVTDGAVTRVQDGRAAGRPAGAAEPGLQSGGLVALFVALFAVTAGVVLLLPAFTAGAAAALRRAPWAALGIGVASLFALPLVTVLLVITVFGIPMALALLAAYPVLLLGGFVVGVLALGMRAAAALHRPAPQEGRSPLGLLALALVAVLLLGLVPVAGPLAIALLALAGIGAGVLHVRARLAGGRRAAPQDAELPLPGRDVFPA